MPNGESTVYKLVILGALIGLGKLLLDEPQLTWRLVIGRLLLGSAVAMGAGVVLIRFPDLPEIALLGIASGLGILGHSVVESLLTRYLKGKVKKVKKS
jgi:hypothetical protein